MAFILRAEDKKTIQPYYLIMFSSSCSYQANGSLTCPASSASNQVIAPFDPKAAWSPNQATWEPPPATGQSKESKQGWVSSLADGLFKK
jgi:hypothetical protein